MQDTKLHLLVLKLYFLPTAIHPDPHFIKAGILTSHFHIWKDYTEPIILVE